MTQPVLTATDLIAWADRTATKWMDLVAGHPQILTMPCDIMDVKTAGGLLQHIVAVQLRYAERLAGLPITEYDAVPFDSVESLYGTHRRAMELLQAQLESEVDWDERIEFGTRSMGQARSSRKTIFFHALLHSIRHYAQLATLVRQHGIKPGWPMDYLAMDIERS